MKRILTFILILFWTSAGIAQYSAAVYLPLGANQASAFSSWNSMRQTLSTPPTISGNRPVLLGISGRNLELLQDAVARKYPRVTQGSSLSVAQRVLADTTQSSYPKLRGYMAEAMFLDKNPEWGYVTKTNASQHDVYAKMPDGGPGLRTGQIKFHMSGDASIYARDMIKDYRSGSFLVPDDHVDQLRAYLKAQADKLRAAGDTAGAQARYRDMNRVKGIGTTASQIDKATQQAITEARVARVTPYVFLGVATTLVVAPTVWDWYRGEITGEQAAYRLIKGGSTVASAIAAEQVLKQWKGGLLRGTLRGNVMVACAVLIVDTSWQVYEYGGFAYALKSPEFIINLGGGISATVCAIEGMYWGAKGGALLAVVLGQSGPQALAPDELVTVPVFAFFGGVIGGTVGGTVGYFGGAEGTRWFMETFCPENLYEQERAYVQNVRDGIDESIVQLQTMESGKDHDS